MTVNVQEKSPVDMKCLFRGRPTLSIRLINATDPEQFLHQRQPEIDVSVDEQPGEVLLTIDQVPCEASGIYRCEVNNILGQDSQNRTLLVHCKFHLRKKLKLYIVIIYTPKNKFRAKSLKIISSTKLVSYLHTVSQNIMPLCFCEM